ncbi:uncharacterized protein KY384_001156 [Bacidia gigantensis]|uniref:uncharacterized protein n=1 Tax=Bacidia gigantensis TaxID=2732470 RepID=UPI001D045971|nr:uncharacterized protein KY384_001156 [Bacidia gigantensis]KAG8534312.1 hypothetical protein KY384_001156 [Bacidia gigantensis]
MDSGVKRLRLSEETDESCAHLVSFYTSSWLSHSAAPIDKPCIAFSYDLIAFLTATQWRHIDILPITWQPALETAGRGATAEIQQSIINIASSFVFKRYFTSTDPKEVTDCFSHTTSELCILGHPSIREHPNIVKLQGVCWDVVSENQVFPVLVFEKAEHGNLLQFMVSAEARALTSEQCLKLIADVANAVVTMHSCDIVHGDLKPENILVRSDKAMGFRAEVCDFGYSCFGASESLFRLPSSWPWTAPEWHNRGFRLSSAKKTDTYSLGLICLWLLRLHDDMKHDKSASILNQELDMSRVPPADKPGYQWVETTRVVDQTHEILDECLKKVDDLGECQIDSLRTFLLTALDNEPSERALVIEELPHRDQSQSTLCAPEFGDFERFFVKTFFQINNNIEQLIGSHISVRSSIARYLEVWTVAPGLNELKERASLQFAICLEIGFGVPQDSKKSASLLSNFGFSSESVEAHLAPIHQRTIFAWKSPSILSMANKGFLEEMRYPYEYRKIMPQESIERTYQRELEDMGRVFRRTHPIVTSLSMQLASVFRIAGRLTDARTLLIQLIGKMEAETNFPVSGVVLDNARADLALVAQNQGDYKSAKQIAMSVIEVRNKSFGPAHPHTLNIKDTLATIYLKEGDYSLAGELFKDCLDIKTHAYGSEHPETLGSAGNLAQLLLSQGALNDAEDLASKVYHGFEKILGASNISTLISAGNLAACLRSMGKYEEARALYEKVLGLSERHNGASHPSTLNIMSNLALLHLDFDHFDAAENLLKQVISERETSLGRKHPSTQLSINSLACVMRRQHDLVSAEELYQEVFESSQEALGKEHPHRVIIANNLALIYQEQHKYEQAEKLYQWAYDVNKNRVGGSHPTTLKILSNIAGAKSKQGKMAEAESTYQHLLSQGMEVLGPAHPETIARMGNLAALMREQGKFEEAESINRKVLDAKIQRYGRNHSSVLTTVSNLANLLLAREEWAAAEEMALWARDGRREVLGERHPATIDSGMILRMARNARRK